MLAPSSKRLAFVIAVAAAVFGPLISPRSAEPQAIPLNTFTIADGLAHNGITQIFQDKNGYLWVATGEGLSRFDGYSFKNFGTADGLTSSYLNDVTADRNGELWVAINDGGIAQFVETATAEKRFRSFSVSDRVRANNVGQIVFDKDNRLWCATEAGVFRARTGEVADNDFEFIGPERPKPMARSAFMDSRDRLWFGLVGRMMLIEAGRPIYFDLEAGDTAFVKAIAERPGGGVIAATSSAIYELFEDTREWTRINVSLDQNQSIETIAVGPDGVVRIGTNVGLIEYRAGHRKLYSKESGLGSSPLQVVFTDRDDNLWIGTRGGGLSNRTSNAVVSYASALESKPYRFMDDRDGNLYVQSGCLPEPTRLSTISPDGILPASSHDARVESCARPQFLNGSDGRWWIGSQTGLQTFNSLKATAGTPVLLPDEKAVEKFLAIYEDRSGAVWLSAIDRNLYLADVDPGHTPRLRLIAQGVGASSILMDSHNVLWLANNTYLGRLRSGQLEEIRDIGVVDRIQPRTLFEDAAGRVWIGTRFNGVLVTDDPSADRPTFWNITKADGLGSDAIWSIGEDDAGGMYFGTSRGLVRYEPSTGVVRRFTSADSIPESSVTHIHKGRDGLMWIASDAGVLRIDPKALDKNLRPPPVLISRVKVEGSDISMAENGVAELTLAELASDQNSVSIEFVGLNLRGEASLNYRYLLEGHDEKWSPLSKQREVNFANLGAGSYRFLVKAIDQRGVESETPAVLQFAIPPPVWQRWWFVSLALIAAGFTLYAIYRYKMARVVELERVRTRIATDLHDDIGSNLTRIALMSEVLNQQGGNGASHQMLPSIANIARESVASMNDIVWAISPEHDRVLDLTRRMRQHAEEVFTIRDIDVEFVSGSTDSELKLPVGVRRDVLLIFKEAVNNAARHSGCTRVKIEFSCTSSRLHLLIADNGKGFAETAERAGHGLSSMTRRGTALGGKLEIRSADGSGTKVEFDMPL